MALLMRDDELVQQLQMLARRYGPAKVADLAATALARYAENDLKFINSQKADEVRKAAVNIRVKGELLKY